MGSWSSKVVNSSPAAFATPFIPKPSNIVSERDRQTWKSYDYVVVGGGASCHYSVGFRTYGVGTMQALPVASSRHDCPRIPIPLSCS